MHKSSLWHIALADRPTATFMVRNWLPAVPADLATQPWFAGVRYFAYLAANRKG